MPAIHDASDAFVFFGATGDLAYKKVFPALQALFRDDGFDLPIIGMARAGSSVEKLRERARDSIEHNGGIDEKAFARLSARLDYVGGDYEDADTYTRLKQALGGAKRPLHYLAIAPSLFAGVVERMAKAGCTENARVVVEKPFGRDLASAQALNRTLHAVFPEESIYRIDHYLGKEAVQNLLYYRFANAFLEPVWNRDHIDSVKITMAEKFGVDGRGAFYEEVGAIRDVVQNHLLQVLALLTMDAPVAHDAEAIRMEKLRLFRAMRPLESRDIVRGQFRGYRDEAGVAKDSNVETFAALRIGIDTWRWSGVPFYIRTGKCLPITATEVVVTLKQPPIGVFDDDEPAANYFRFRLGPEEVIATGARIKRPGEAMRGEAVELVAHHRAQREKTPYQRLLGDALRGDPALFTRDDVVEAAWRVIGSALDAPEPVQEYEPGSWGPPRAANLLAGDDRWHDPRPEPPAS